MAVLLHRASGRWRLGLGLSLLTTFLWGVLPVALTVAVQAVDVFTLIWFRFLVSFGLLFAILALRKGLPTVRELRSLPWGLLVVAVAGLAGNYLLFMLGMVQTTPANAEVIIQFAPVFLGLGALTVFKESYSAVQWLGLGIFALGFVLFFNQQLGALAGADGYLGGVGLVVAASAAWAAYALAQKQLLRALSSSAVMLLVYIACALIFAPLAHPEKLLALDGLHAGVIGFCALNTLIAYGAFAEALEHWEASRVSAVLTLAPVVTLAAVWFTALIWPGLIAPEHLDWVGLGGALLVVAGSLALALGRPAPAPKHTEY